MGAEPWDPPAASITSATTMEPAPLAVVSPPQREEHVRVAAGRPSAVPHVLSNFVADSKLETVVLPDGSLRHIAFRHDASVPGGFARVGGRWVRRSTLGRDVFGTGHLEHCMGERGGLRMRAVKVIAKAVLEQEGLDYKRELETVFKFSHPKYVYRFVSSQDWFEGGGSISIALEYIPNGDLERHLTRPLPEREARQIIAQVLEGLGYMHPNDYVHRDLKPGNIMVVSTGPAWFVKIADFGISKRRHGDATFLNSANRFTLGYAAPEQLGMTGTADEVKRFPFAADMWALGAVAFHILTGSVPFNLSELMAYVSRSAQFPAARLRGLGVSDEGLDLIHALLSPAAEDRPSASVAASHPWTPASLGSQTTGHTIIPAEPARGATALGGEYYSATVSSVASAAWTEEESGTVTTR